MLFDKKIDSLVARAFIGPYFMAFIIAEFVLVMQFLWKYIDEITGKGIGVFEILELVFYFGLTLIPKAIPITILLSSVFVFGNMSEKFELTSMKSAGISLFRIMRVGMMIGVLTALLSVIASNLIVPKANFVFLKSFYAIKKQKPTLVIEQGMFNEDFANFKIYVGKKESDGRNISDVIIYDQSNVESKRINVITAQRGEMHSSPDGKLFYITLYDGEQVRELKENLHKTDGKKKYPMTRSKFVKWQKSFDMGEFQVQEDENFAARKKFDLMNTPQLLYSIDSVSTEMDVLRANNVYNYSDLVTAKLEKVEGKNLSKAVGSERSFDRNTERQKAYQKKLKSQGKPAKIIYKSVLIDSVDVTSVASFLNILLPDQHETILSSARTKANHMNNQVQATRNKVKSAVASKNRILYKLHQQYSWAVICFLFLFIGAPLGSIIRKGGYGVPLLISILFFMLFIIMGIMGDRLQQTRVLNPYVAAWLPNIVLLPFAVVFTYKAIRDARFNFNWFKFPGMRINQT